MKGERSRVSDPMLVSATVATPKGTYGPLLAHHVDHVRDVARGR
jgi:hypothetical protein